jgi:hypothetical protein
MSEERRFKHLDFIQLTITRMGANSFLLKAWAVTLVAGLFALATKDSALSFVLVAYLPVVTFWILDGFYLHQERLYRALYDRVRSLDVDAVDFAMDTTELRSTQNSWLSAMMSRTLIIFYGTLLVVIVVVTWVVR